MPARVTFASARPKELRPDATLPAALERMLKTWNFKKRFAGKRVAIKMHLGGNMGYSTIHPYVQIHQCAKLKMGQAKYKLVPVE